VGSGTARVHDGPTLVAAGSRAYPPTRGAIDAHTRNRAGHQCWKTILLSPAFRRSGTHGALLPGRTARNIAAVGRSESAKSRPRNHTDGHLPIVRRLAGRLPSVVVRKFLHVAIRNRC